MLAPPLPAWVRPHALLLDVDGGTENAVVKAAMANPAFAKRPALLDLVLRGECVTAIAPSYRWGGVALRNLTAELPGIAPASVGAHDDSAADRHVMVLRWCHPRVTGHRVLNVTLRLPGAAAGARGVTTTVTRDETDDDGDGAPRQLRGDLRDDSDLYRQPQPADRTGQPREPPISTAAPSPAGAGALSIGACTLFRDPARVLTRDDLTTRAVADIRASRVFTQGTGKHPT